MAIKNGFAAVCITSHKLTLTNLLPSGSGHGYVSSVFPLPFSFTCTMNLFLCDSRCDSSPLCCSHETPPRVLCSALRPPAHEGHGSIRMNPQEGHEDDHRAGAPFL